MRQGVGAPAIECGPAGLLAEVGSDWIVDFPLVAEGQNADLAACRHEPVEGHVSRSSERDDELAQVTADAPPDQGVADEHLDRALDRLGSRRGGVRIVLRQEGECPLKVRKRVARVDYPRHGLGRRAFLPLASRTSQA